MPKPGHIEIPFATASIIQMYLEFQLRYVRSLNNERLKTDGYNPLAENDIIALIKALQCVSLEHND